MSNNTSKPNTFTMSSSLCPAYVPFVSPHPLCRYRLHKRRALIVFLPSFAPFSTSTPVVSLRPRSSSLSSPFTAPWQRTFGLTLLPIHAHNQRSYLEHNSAGSGKVGGDGAFFRSASDASSSVRATCRVAGKPDLYYYSTTFSGGPGVCTLPSDSQYLSSPIADHELC